MGEIRLICLDTSGDAFTAAARVVPFSLEEVQQGKHAKAPAPENCILRGDAEAGKKKAFPQYK